jgi:malate dehydrogenase (oxaloacetate-decarboxylating)
VALGTMVSDASCVSDSMFVAAAHALAACVPRESADRGALFPSLAKLRSVTRRLALAVAREAQAEGVASCCDEDVLQARVEEVWTPTYVEYRRG